MSPTVPVILKKENDWSPDHVLVIDCENTADHMVNVIAVFIGSGREVAVRCGVFPHWPCRVPLPLKVAEGGTLHLDRTPGRFKAMVGGANLSVEDLEKITVRPTDGAERDLVITAVTVEPAMPAEYPMPPEPLVDSLHQWRTREWPGKAVSLDELKNELERELAAPVPAYPDAWSAYGGWQEKRFSATGFFRVENECGTWWMVDPDGYAFWSMGCCCVRTGSGVNVAGIEPVFEEALPDAATATHLWTERKGGRIFAGMVHNLERALGPEWKTKWLALTAKRLKEFRFNTIANWSDPALFPVAGVPYVFTMQGFPSTERRIFRDFPDVFDPAFEENSTVFARQLAGIKDDPLVIGYFMTNEPQWAFVQEFDLGAQLLMADAPFASLDVLIADLADKYGTVGALNSAWGASFTAFDDLRQAQDPRRFPGCAADTRAFTEKAVERFVRIPALACRAADMNHMNLGLRWAFVHSDYQLAGADLLDAFSINCYQYKPAEELINRIAEKTGKPVMIGEFHIGSLDKGLPSGGIRTTRTMRESVEAYRYYVEQGAAMPNLVGVHYFQWNDQHVMGRFDGENMQIGMHDVTCRPYAEWEEVCRSVHPDLYRIRTGEKDATEVQPAYVPEGTLVW